MGLRMESSLGLGDILAITRKIHEKKTHPKRLVMYSAYSPRASLWNARLVSVSFAAWVVSAFRILGWLCPWLTALHMMD